MSKDIAATSHSKEHGSTGSYIVGYILSLIFTFIPFYLVVNEVLQGDTLLVVILGIAILQMIVQIVFFLHLGRGPKPLYNVVFFFATGGIIVLVIGASLFIMSNLYQNMTPDETVVRLAQREGISQIGGTETGACQGKNSNHVITISDGKPTPERIEAKRCDTLTFLNEDSVDRELGFGIHPNDVSYGGEFVVVLDDGRPETITLNEEGEFTYHDHKDFGLMGNFYVGQEDADQSESTEPSNGY